MFTCQSQLLTVVVLSVRVCGCMAMATLHFLVVKSLSDLNN
jgi:hypothetical protein